MSEKPFTRVFVERDVDTGVPASQLARAAREERVSVEGWLARKDGTRFRARTVIRSLEDVLGRPEGHVAVTSPVAVKYTEP